MATSVPSTASILTKVFKNEGRRVGIINSLDVVYSVPGKTGHEAGTPLTVR
jgi:hypothetical protein